MSFSNPLKRTVAAAFSLVIVGQACLVDASQATLWGDRRASAVTVAALSLSLPPASALSPAVPLPFANLSPAVSPLIAALSPEFGSVRDVQLPSGAVAGVVINVQDVHHNAEAQENIRRATLSLAGAGVETAALEGAEGPLRVEPLRAAIPSADRADIARFLLKENRISGPAAAAIASNAKLTLLGVDDAPLHAANVDAYRRSLHQKEPLAAQLASARAGIARRKADQFSPELARFDTIVESHQAGEVAFGAYVTAVRAAAGIDKASVSLFLQAYALESRLDFAAVERDRRAVLEQITAHASKPDLQRLLDLTVALRTGGVTSAGFYGELARFCDKARVPLGRFPAFQSYLHYVSLSEGIRPAELLADVAALEKRAFERLARTPAEKNLVQDAHWLVLAGKLSDFSLSNDEWREYAANARPTLAPPAAALRPFEDFYLLAARRDEAIARRTLIALAATPNARLTLVTGGFHAAGVQRRLLDAGVAVVTFAPRLTRTADGSAYLSVFAREKTPLEKLFAGERLFLAANPLPDDIRAGVIPGAALARAALQGRAPAFPTAFVQSSAPDAGVTGADVRLHDNSATARVERANGAVDVNVGLAANGEIAVISESAPTDTYALGFRLFGRLANWRRVTDVMLSWIVEFPSVVAAAFRPAAFDRLLARHWNDLAAKRAALTRLTAAIRAGLFAGALSAAVTAAIYFGPSFEARLVLGVLTASAVGGALALSVVASFGHLSQNIFGTPLTTGNPALGSPKYIRNARIFTAQGEGVVLAARFEFAPVPGLRDREEALGNRVMDVVARRQLSGATEEGRSLVLPLDEPVTVNGRTFDSLVLKRVTYRGDVPNLNEWVPTEDEQINQPTVVLRTGHDNTVGMSALWRRATGTGPVSDSIAEFREMRRAGPLAPYPIGIGEFPALVSEGRTMGFLGYLDNASSRVRSGTASRAATGRLRTATNATMAPLMIDAMRTIAANARGAARSLERLHDAGMVHQAPHPDQFGVTVDGQSRVYDLDDAVWIGRLTRDEYIFLRINDFLQLYYSFHLIANRVNSVGPANAFYDQFLPMVGAENPIRALVETYFSSDQALSLGASGIWAAFRPRASRDMPYSRFWSGFGDEPTPFSALNPEIWAIAAHLGGPVYDRFLEERVLAPLVRRGIPADTLRPYLQSLHARALRQGSLSARDVAREMRGVRLRSGWARQIAEAITAFAELPAPQSPAPLLVLPFTTWLVGYVYRLFNPFSTFLARDTTLPATRASFRWMGERAAVAFNSFRMIFATWGRSVPDKQKEAIERAYAGWRRTSSTSPEHLEARRRLAERVRNLPMNTAGTDIKADVLTSIISLFPDSEPYEIAEFADVAHSVIPLIPFTPAGDEARLDLIDAAIPLLENADFWVRGRALTLINELLGLSPSQEAVRFAFPAIAAMLVDSDHGNAIHAARIVQELLPNVPSADFAVRILQRHRAGIATRRSIPDPTGGARALFSTLTDIADRGDFTGIERASWMSKSRDAANKLVGRPWFRSLVVPGIELPGLPGFVFIYFGLVSLAAPALAPWLAPVLAGAMFAVLHGAPGDMQTWKTFGARTAAATVISGAALATTLSISGLTGLGAAFLVAYVLHGLWNAYAPRAWRLTLGGASAKDENVPAERAAASLVLDALDVLSNDRPDTRGFALTLDRLAAEAAVNQDISSVEGRLAVLRRSGLLDGGRVAAEMSAASAARGRVLTLNQARAALQDFAFHGAATRDIEDALRDSTAVDNVADVVVAPPTLSVDAERRLMTVLSARQTRRDGRGEAVVMASDPAQAARLRAQGAAGVSVIMGTRVLGDDLGHATVDVARVTRLLADNAVDLNNFSNVNLIAPAGHTLLVDGLSPDLPWVRRAAIVMIDDLLQSVSTTMPTLYQLERAARTVASQA